MKGNPSVAIGGCVLAFAVPYLLVTSCDPKQKIVEHHREYVWPQECVRYGIDHNIYTKWDGEFCEYDTTKDPMGNPK